MATQYIGHLSRNDPLYHYLQFEILPQMGRPPSQPHFRVFRLGGSNDVYRYEEKQSHAQLIGKFFNNHGVPPAQHTQRMEQEFHNLHLIRSYGFVGYPHDIIRPLGYNGWLNSLLVEEYSQGHSLSTIMTDAIVAHQPERLYTKLTALAYFLATLHNRTANGMQVDFQEDCAYLDHLTRQLAHKRLISGEERQEFAWLRDRWREQPRMWEDQQVLVHGDATPANFLFGQGLEVIGIDLERMKRADRVFDVGRITGELQHFFLRLSGNKYAAEPFIGHFLWEYACHFPDRDSAFRSICGRLPFQMGLTLLRIARNTWLDHAYQQRLVAEAKILLRGW